MRDSNSGTSFVYSRKRQQRRLNETETRSTRVEKDKNV